MKRSLKSTRSTKEGLYDPLCNAVRYGRLRAVQFLLQEGANPAIRDSTSENSPENTPLHLAVINPKLNPLILALLIKWNTSLELKNLEGLTPLSLALKNWRSVQEDKIELLLRAGCRCSWEEWKDILEKSVSVDPVYPDSVEKLETIETILREYCFEPRSLKKLCCFSVRRALGSRLMELAPNLPLPSSVIRLVLLEEVHEVITSKYRFQVHCDTRLHMFERY